MSSQNTPADYEQVATALKGRGRALLTAAEKLTVCAIETGSEGTILRAEKCERGGEAMIAQAAEFKRRGDDATLLTLSLSL
jgi:hypothetical protein